MCGAQILSSQGMQSTNKLEQQGRSAQTQGGNVFGEKTKGHERQAGQWLQLIKRHWVPGVRQEPH